LKYGRTGFKKLSFRNGHLLKPLYFTATRCRLKKSDSFTNLTRMYNTIMEQKKDIPTLYQWAGGTAALEKLTEVFYDKVLKDHLLYPVFKNMAADHSKHVAHFIGEVFGGPKQYTTHDKGSHAIMVAHHLGKMLTEEKRKRWIDLLLQSADEVGLADDPEFRSALVAYLEWGSRIAVINSNINENPIDESAPMPKWGWGETGGPYVP